MNRHQPPLRKVSVDVHNGREDWETMDTAPQLIQERSAPPATLVIFGASGDLTRRKLLPAVESLARHNRLPEQFAQDMLRYAFAPLGKVVTVDDVLTAWSTHG